MAKDFRLHCPYCDNYFSKDFRICKQYGNYRDVICDNCGGKFQASIYVEIKSTSYEDELEKVLPQDIIKIVRDVCSKYLNYTGKGGYENSRTITINDKIEEMIRPYDNCYHITLGGKAKYYENEYRTVFFDIFPDGHIDYRVGAMYVWHQKYWWQGNTIEEKINNYIQHALIKWETI